MSAQAVYSFSFGRSRRGMAHGLIVQGTGFGLIADICIGIVGALIGSWLFPQLGVHVGDGLVNSIVVATVGAVLLLLILRLFSRGGRWWVRVRRRFPTAKALEGILLRARMAVPEGWDGGEWLKFCAQAQAKRNP